MLKSNHGMVVNLYQVAKMLGYNSLTLARINLKESYEIDKYTRKYKNMTFEEYVNSKRHHIACILDNKVYL